MGNISNYIQQNMQGWSLSKHLIIYSNYDVICYNQEIYHIYKSIWGNTDLAVHDIKDKKTTIKQRDIDNINKIIVESSLGQRYKQCVEDFHKALNEIDFNVILNKSWSLGAGGGLRHIENRIYNTSSGVKTEEMIYQSIRELLGKTGNELTSQDELIIKKIIRNTRKDDFSLKEAIKGWMNDRVGDATEGSGFQQLINANGMKIDLFATGSITYSGAQNFSQFRDIFNNKSHPKEYSGSQQKIDDFIRYNGQEFSVSMKSHWGSPGRHDNTIQSNPQRLRHLFEISNLYGVESEGIGYWIFLNDALFNNINWTMNKIKLVYGSYFGNVDLFMEWTFNNGEYGEIEPQLYIYTKDEIIKYLYDKHKITLASQVEQKRLKVTWDDKDPEYNKKLVLNNIFINALTINLSSINK